MREARNTVERASTLAEWLPNQAFSIEDSEPEPLAAGLVRGTVVGVSPGRSYYVGDGPEADAERGIEIDFGDPRALWSVIEVAIEPSETLGEISDGIVRVGVVTDGPDHQAMLDDISALGEVVVVLDSQGFFKYSPELYNVAGFGSLFGDIGPGGEVAFPALGEQENAKFLGSLTSWEAIREAFAMKRPVIRQGRLGLIASDEAS